MNTAPAAPPTATTRFKAVVIYNSDIVPLRRFPGPCWGPEGPGQMMDHGPAMVGVGRQVTAQGQQVNSLRSKGLNNKMFLDNNFIFH